MDDAVSLSKALLEDCTQVAGSLVCPHPPPRVAGGSSNDYPCYFIDDETDTQRTSALAPAHAPVKLWSYDRI